MEVLRDSLEKQKQGDYGFEELKSLVKGNMDAFEVCSKLYNTRDSQKSFSAIKELRLGPEEILHMYKLGAVSDISKFSELMLFYASIDEEHLNTLRVFCSDDKNIDVKSFLLITGISITESLRTGSSISTAIEDTVTEIFMDGHKGSKIYEDYEKMFVELLSNMIFSNISVGSNPSEDLNEIGVPEDSLATVSGLISKYNKRVSELNDASKLLHK
jgi:hypothetical protein